MHPFKQREAALDALYKDNPKRALELDAQMMRDDVVMLRLEEGEPRETGTPQKEIEAKARARGPITQEEAVAAYMAMVKDDSSDEARILIARSALGEARTAAVRLAHRLAELLRDYHALRQAVAGGRIDGKLTVAELLKDLAGASKAAQASPIPAPTEPGGFESGDRHCGTPLGNGAAYLERRPQAPEPETRYREPPAPPRVVEGEVRRPSRLPPPIEEEPEEDAPDLPTEQPARLRPALSVMGDPRSRLGPADYDSEDRQPLDLDDDSVQILGPGRHWHHQR